MLFIPDVLTDFALSWIRPKPSSGVCNIEVSVINPSEAGSDFVGNAEWDYWGHVLQTHSLLSTDSTDL